MLPLMQVQVPHIVEEFYAHLFEFSETRLFFADGETLVRVKAAQREYLLDLFRGNYGDDYFEKRLQIGVVHERIGLVPKWYIGSNSKFLCLIGRHLVDHYRFRPGKLARCMLALTKIMNLDQQLVIDTYIGSLLEKVQEREELERLLAQIRETVAVLSSASTEILSTTTQVAAGTAETATAVSETTATLEEVKQTAQLSSQKARFVSDSAQKASQVALSGRKSVEEATQGMQRIQEQMESIAESIVRLSEQSQAIGEIIATVNDMAEQSKLLAVNAAIEANKAGDQGKGFVVVAQEIKSLAEQSKQATTQVRAILGDIQRATSAAVMAAEQGNKAVQAGVVQTAETGESIHQLADSIAEAAQAATQIAASSQQQMVGMDQVALAMENIKQASAQNVSGTRQAEVAAQSLHELGRKLSGLIGGRAA
jgi:methyl-accepting chemotaxis protein